MIKIDDAKWPQVMALAGLCMLLAGCPGGATQSMAKTSSVSAGGAATTSSVTGGGATTTSSVTGSGATTTSGVTGGGAATLSWTAPTLNTDGSILSDLAGYHIYYGTSATALSHEADVSGAATTTYTVNGLSPGTYYFAVAAYSSEGTESMPTPTVSKTI